MNRYTVSLFQSRLFANVILSCAVSLPFLISQFLLHALKEVTSGLIYNRENPSPRYFSVRFIFHAIFHSPMYRAEICISLFPYSLVSQRRHGFANIRASTNSFVDIRYFVHKLHIQFSFIFYRIPKFSMYFFSRIHSIEENREKERVRRRHMYITE